jgi:hypothetical protein
MGLRVCSCADNFTPRGGRRLGALTPAGVTRSLMFRYAPEGRHPGSIAQIVAQCTRLCTLRLKTFAIDRELACLSCAAPLQSRQGRFVLKYFLLKRSYSAVTPRSPEAH